MSVAPLVVCGLQKFGSLSGGYTHTAGEFARQNDERDAVGL